MTSLTKLNFITGNKNKLAEVRAILGNVIEVDNQAVDVPEIQGTIAEIAKEKSRRAAEAVCRLPYACGWAFLLVAFARARTLIKIY